MLNGLRAVFAAGALALPGLAFQGLVLQAAGPGAQVEVGDPAPEIKIKQLTNGEATSMKELDGKLILLEYFAYW